MKAIKELRKCRQQQQRAPSPATTMSKITGDGVNQMWRRTSNTRCVRVLRQSTLMIFVGFSCFNFYLHSTQFFLGVFSMLFCLCPHVRSVIVFVIPHIRKETSKTCSIPFHCNFEDSLVAHGVCSRYRCVYTKFENVKNIRIERTAHDCKTCNNVYHGLDVDISNQTKERERRKNFLAATATNYHFILPNPI